MLGAERSPEHAGQVKSGKGLGPGALSLLLPDCLMAMQICVTCSESHLIH